MLYEDTPCPTGPPGGCDPTKGTGVSVTQGTTTRFIDLALPLRARSGITGMVSDLLTGAPIVGVHVDFLDSDTGDYELSVLSSSAGTYIVDVDPGSFVAGTDNSGDWINQIWDGIECLGGSAYNGDCDPLTGSVITVEENLLTGNIDFLLFRRSFFSDGFETGDTTLWSATGP